MREIVFDTETTGLDPKTGDRMVEIGCIELVNRVPTGRTFHAYYNPERPMPVEAERVHGLGDSFLFDKPRFHESVLELLDFLEAGQRRGIGEHAAAELGSIYALRPGGAWKSMLYRLDKRSTRSLQAVHNNIGIEDRYAKPGEHSRHGRFAHADRPGQTEDEGAAHRCSRRRKSASPGSRIGATPKNRSNASAAWPISMARPSTVRKPAARAACSTGVSSGSVTMS